MSARSTCITDTNAIKTSHDCETVNIKQSNKAVRDEAKMGEKEDLKKESRKTAKSPWNRGYLIFFVGIICILTIFSLIGLLKL